MQAWVKLVEREKVEEGRLYFLAKRNPNSGMPLFYARDINDKYIWSEKPGIAVKVYGGDKLRETLFQHAEYVAVEVPDDANRRWKRRQKGWRRERS